MFNAGMWDLYACNMLKSQAYTLTLFRFFLRLLLFVVLRFCMHIWQSMLCIIFVAQKLLLLHLGQAVEFFLMPTFFVFKID